MKKGDENVVGTEVECEHERGLLEDTYDLCTFRWVDKKGLSERC